MTCKQRGRGMIKSRAVSSDHRADEPPILGLGGAALFPGRP